MRMSRKFALKFFPLCPVYLALTLNAQTSLPVYTDSLVNGFQDWGWATHNYANTSPVHSGSKSASVTIATANYDGLQIYHPDFDSSPYASLSFWINGGSSGGQQLHVYGLLHVGSTNNAGQTHVSLDPLPTNTWQQVTIPLSSLDVANRSNFTGFVIQSSIGATQSTFYLDDIQLDANPPPSIVHVGIDSSHSLRAADNRWFGLNTAVWDSNFDTTSTSNALAELGTQILRFPGGSLSDFYHWNTATRSDGYQWDPTKFANFIHIVTNAGAQAMITVNYGTGTSNEAAAWVKSANVTNHLGFKYWEIGNECYGTWEADSNSLPHDPYTYALRAKNYIALMKAADPTIKIGVPVVTGEDNNDNGYSGHPAYNLRTGTYHNGWTPVVLSTLASFGITPDFVVHHVYPEYVNDSDATLLQASSNWAVDAANLRQQISDYLGAPGTNIELLCTENNADAGAQGRQSTSLVNGLYLADSLAQLMKTEINAFIWWDLRNGTDTGGDFDSSLYGWRTYGDLGIINGSNTRHPVFYTFKLMQYFAQAGDTILNGTSDYSQLSAYASRKANGALALLVINKDRYATLDAQLSLTNFVPWTNALVRSYGITQDEASRTNAPAAAQDLATNFAAIAGSVFTNAFPPYSVTLLTIPPTAPQLDVLPPANDQCVVQVQGQPKARYVVQSSTNLISWKSVATNTLDGNVWNFTNTPSVPVRFWRALWQP